MGKRYVSRQRYINRQKYLLSIENTSINYEIFEDKNVPILVDDSVNNINAFDEHPMSMNHLS
jgi:hypothetical protein